MESLPDTVRLHLSSVLTHRESDHFSIATPDQMAYTSGAMTERITTKLPKWPFLLADVSLLILAGFIVYQSAWPLGLWQIVLSLAAVSLGAWLCVMPFLHEFRMAARVAESHALSTALAQIGNLEAVQNKIEDATGQWMTVQEHSARTVQAAKEIADRFKNEAQEACSFLEKANDREKAHLRLEAEKLRRAEKEWLQATVFMLDHVFALHQAASRSGQPRLIAQLTQFQQACREGARRLGLVAFAANPGDPFDASLHQLNNSNGAISSDARIADTLAPGFTFQGQLIRKALVALDAGAPSAGVSEVPDNSAAAESSEGEPANPIATAAGESAPSAQGAGQKELGLE